MEKYTPKRSMWFDDEMKLLEQFEIVTNIFNMPPTGMISFRYVWKAARPGDGEYQVLQGHHPIFRSNDVEEAVEAFINWRDHAQKDGE